VDGTAAVAADTSAAATAAVPSTMEPTR